jgi:hypothetical protein
MTVAEIVKDKWLNALPLILAGCLYLIGYVYRHHPEWVISNMQQFSFTEFAEKYGAPFTELSIILTFTAIIALFISKRLYKYWLAVFGMWLIVTLWWMLSISDPRGQWENYRSTAADFSGIGLFLGTLIWLGGYYFIERRKKS